MGTPPPNVGIRRSASPKRRTGVVPGVPEEGSDAVKEAIVKRAAVLAGDHEAARNSKEPQAQQKRISSMKKQCQGLMQRADISTSEAGSLPPDDAEAWNEYDRKVRRMAANRFAQRTIILDAGFDREERD
jgi:hypothetical protein